MYETVTQSEFIDRFRQSEERKNHLSYDGFIALYDYFEELEDSIDEELKFDMIAICCEYSQLTLKEFKEQYDDEEPEDYIVCWVNDDEFIIRDF